jgi:hypothetical protein
MLACVLIHLFAACVQCTVQLPYIVMRNAVVQGHSAPTREELESGGGDSASPDATSSTPGPSGRPSDSHATSEDGVQRNARPGEFAPNDPKKPEQNIPEHSRGTSGQ